MINTRLSIFKSLRKKIKEMTRHGNMDPSGFKDILYGVILNDMKEWSEYIPNGDGSKIVDILNRYILEHPSFQIERFVDNPDLYRNVNTPQDNTTWRLIRSVKVIKLDGKEEFRTFAFDEPDGISFYEQSKFTTECPVCEDNEAQVSIHDKTLFENERNDSNNPDLVSIR